LGIWKVEEFLGDSDAKLDTLLEAQPDEIILLFLSWLWVEL